MCGEGRQASRPAASLHTAPCLGWRLPALGTNHCAAPLCAGEPLPEELFTKLKAAKNYRSGSMMLRQVHFSKVDLELHARYKPGAGDASVFDVDQRIAKKCLVMQPFPEVSERVRMRGRAWPCSALLHGGHAWVRMFSMPAVWPHGGQAEERHPIWYYRVL